jgi:hypothetical protein
VALKERDRVQQATEADWPTRTRDSRCAEPSCMCQSLLSRSSVPTFQRCELPPLSGRYTFETSVYFNETTCIPEVCYFNTRLRFSENLFSKQTP